MENNGPETRRYFAPLILINLNNPLKRDAKIGKPQSGDDQKSLKNWKIISIANFQFGEIILCLFGYQ